MNKITIALTALMLLALALIMAPNILALNRGKILRNVAIWLAIFVGLGLLYQVTHGGTALHFGAPLAPLHTDSEPAQKEVPGSKNDGDQGFIPPKE